ncbi:MAG TPA: histidine phosphatase family protein [Methylomirabilota bacterium]|nr:histidine phosphatase family protein [Methylomirabilota bacterium]
MKLLLIRHAIAMPSGTPGLADDDRPLTSRGRARFRAAARGLARVLEPPDVLLTSPLPRARATAEIAARAFGRVEPVDERVLAHGDVDAILALLGRQRAGTVALVGHEPALSLLLARLLGSRLGERFAFKKGGAALVDLPGGPAAGGRLIWFLKPRILRTLGDS